MRPLWLTWRDRMRLIGELLELRRAVRAYLEARDRSDPEGERQARRWLEALLARGRR